MKELLIGMGLGFVVGSIMAKTNKCYGNAVENCVDKGRPEEKLHMLKGRFINPRKWRYP